MTTGSPEYRAGQWRGAFHEGRQVGGYIMHQRRMRVGASLLPTACVGAVVTDSTHRMSGVGRALMVDAIAYAVQENQALLLLDGIPNFYARFGYVDVWDATEHALSVAAIVGWAPSRFTVRPATPDDADALLELYIRHYATFTGSFARSIEVWRYWLANASGAGLPWLAIDEGGRIQGYLYRRRDEPWRAEEVASDDWRATLALLQWQVSAAKGRGTIVWPLPPDSALLASLEERLALPEPSDWDHVGTLWSVRSESYHHPDAGWVARPANLPSLFNSLLPAWRDRWAKAGKPWRGTMAIDVADERYVLSLAGDIRKGMEPDAVIRLTPGSLVQLLFGYRDAEYLACRQGNKIPSELIPPLRVLFPTGHAWLPGTDAF